MGKFDGILICSDIDGTFTGSDEIISANKRAVEYFKSEGGRFTFATGRNVSYVRKLEYFDCINAPACLVNGGVVYDYEKEEVLKKLPLPFIIGEFAEYIKEYVGVFSDITFHNGYRDGESLSFTPENIPESIMGVTPLKIVCRFSSVEEADRFKSFALKKDEFKECYIAKSWNTGVEFNNKSATKGEAVKFIKEHLGNIHTSVGIGDYENDIPLLKGADIGVCVGNGHSSLREIADFIVKGKEEYAIADLISLLEKMEFPH